MNRINIVPTVRGVGGMVSFEKRLSEGFQALGIDIIHGFEPMDSDAVLVIGGTRNLLPLWRAKKNGIRIVQRLNGMNWLHRKLKTGLSHFLRAELGNLILRIIRSSIADHIVYQSRFAQDWWEKSFGKLNKPNSIIYNSVDLSQYSPSVTQPSTSQKPSEFNGCARPRDVFRILMVEGSLMGGYEIGLGVAIQLLRKLNEEYSSDLNRIVELVVVGKVSEKLRVGWTAEANFPLVFTGQVDANEIPCIDNSAHLLYSADINAACPNAAIEALACGTPVLGFDTGALGEIVSVGSGKIVPYGADPWELDPPDITGLAESAVELLLNQDAYRMGARERAEEKFDLGQMVKAYQKVIFQT